MNITLFFSRDEGGWCAHITDACGTILYVTDIYLYKYEALIEAKGWVHANPQQPSQV